MIKCFVLASFESNGIEYKKGDILHLSLKDYLHLINANFQLLNL